MEKTNSKLVKSKSSNSNLSKNNAIEKKFRSNATFQTSSVKKRGVYVERRPTVDTLITAADNATPKDSVKAPKRPSRGQKRFLASVLSLLSKSSTGTQCPDKEENKQVSPTNSPNKLKKTIMAEKAITAMGPPKAKKKYKSRILNSSNYPFDTFEVLQSKKHLVQTPSIDLSDDCEVDDIKWSDFLPRLVQPNSEELQIERNKKLSHLVKEVTEGRMTKDRHVTIQNDDLKTLVSENRKNTTKDPGFYNFFVDLLETTFSVCDIKSGDNLKGATSVMSSKVAFEIDENVAEKLNIVPEVNRQSSDLFIHKDDHTKEELVDYFNLCAPRSKSPPQGRKRNKLDYLSKYRDPKLEKHSLILPQSMSMRPIAPFPQTASLSQKKSLYKKSGKQKLLSILKEQLRMDPQPFEESQNLFQALKVLSKNKRKTQKTLRFEKTPDELAGCTFKSRKLLPSKRPKLKNDLKKVLPAPKISDYKKKPKKSETSADKVSNHNLEVVNINYDTCDKTKRNRRSKASHFSPTWSQFAPSSLPVESARDNAFARSYPTAHQIVMRVKSISKLRPEFSNQRGF